MLVGFISIAWRVLWMWVCGVRGADCTVGLSWTIKWLDFVCETNVFETMGTCLLKGWTSANTLICSWCEFHALYNYSLLSSLCALTLFAHNGSNAPVSHINSIKCLRAHSINACRQKMSRYSHSHEFRSVLFVFSHSENLLFNVHTIRIESNDLHFRWMRDIYWSNAKMLRIRMNMIIKCQTMEINAVRIYHQSMNNWAPRLVAKYSALPNAKSLFWKNRTDALLQLQHVAQRAVLKKIL